MRTRVKIAFQNKKKFFIFFGLFTPFFPEFSNNIAIFGPHFAISSDNFKIGTLITARAIDGV
jgi:hypothetical protein